MAVEDDRWLRDEDAKADTHDQAEQSEDARSQPHEGFIRRSLQLVLPARMTHRICFDAVRHLNTAERRFVQKRVGLVEFSEKFVGIGAGAAS